MKKTYYATYLTNNGTHPMYPYEFTNKDEAVRAIRKIAKGETFIGGHASVKVWSDGQFAPVIIYKGRVKN